MNTYPLETVPSNLPISVCDWRQLLTNKEKVISDLGFTSGSAISKAFNGFQKNILEPVPSKVEFLVEF